MVSYYIHSQVVITTNLLNFLIFAKRFFGPTRNCYSVKEGDVDCRCSPTTNYCILTYGDCEDSCDCDDDMKCIQTIPKLGGSMVCVKK